MKITLFLITILFVAADSIKKAGEYNKKSRTQLKRALQDYDYENVGDPKSYPSEEEPGNEYDYNQNKGPNDGTEGTKVDVNEEYMNKILDQTIDEINIKEDAKYE